MGVRGGGFLSGTLRQYVYGRQHDDDCDYCYVLGHFLPPKKIFTRGDTEITQRSRSSAYLFHGDYVDFHQYVLGQAGHFDGGTRWRGRAEIFAVDLVHGGEIVHVLEKNGAAHNFSKATAGGFQNFREVAQDTFGLCGNVSSNNLLSRRIDCDLSGGKYKSIGLDGLRVGANSLWGIFGGYDFAHGNLLVINADAGG